MKETLIALIAKNCDWHKTVNDDFKEVCEDRIYELEQKLPHGAGLNSGCKIDVQNSSSDKVIIHFKYHHMNENGFYCGWTQHSMVVKPKLWNDFDLKISGKNKNLIKEYLYDLFNDTLKEMYDERKL